MLPDFAFDYPTDMARPGLRESTRDRHLQRNILVVLGDADTEVAVPDLSPNEEAMAQGPLRFARAL